MAGKTREERIRLNGSPNFSRNSFEVPGDGAVTLSFDPTDPEAKYLPFDVLEAVNDSAQDARILINQRSGDSVELPNNNSGSWEAPKEISRFRSLRIENLDSTKISSGDIRLSFRRQGMNTDKRTVEKVRAQQETHPLEAAIEGLTGLPLGPKPGEVR